MPVQDHKNFYDALTGTIPNTVSRSIQVGDRSIQTVVIESGKPILDSELNLAQDAAAFANSLVNQSQAPSGWVRGQTRYDGYNDYATVNFPNGFTHDDSGSHHDGTKLINAFVMPRMVAQVAGMPVVVEYTNTRDDGFNLVALQAPTQNGTPLTFKRTDFVFLEVWKALVAPSPRAWGSVTVVSFGDLVPGDIVAIDGHNLTATAVAPGVDEFQIGANNDDTAANIATGINAGPNWWMSNNSTHAFNFGPVVKMVSIAAGAAGNGIAIGLTLTNAGCITKSGANFTGGADRPNKPDQMSLYRHGNVLSPMDVRLADDLIDYSVLRESTQRVQLQYRIRCTGVNEAINYKTHPDGFSTQSGGNMTTVAWGGTGADVPNYPFVPADRASASANSDAAAYGIEDAGLWIAGRGDPGSAQDLNALDGYVYAIPICFVHRYNDVSSFAPFGFNPEGDSNGAPLHNHGGYVNAAGILGAIPPATSDRPDGNFADVIIQNNLLDLRRHIIFPGIDTAAELQYQIQSLLDGSTRTWSVDAASKNMLGNGSGDVSTRFLVCNEIGRSVAHGGFGTATTRGKFIREFDHIARRFADQAVIERFVVAFWPGDREVGPAFAPGLVNPGKFVAKASGTVNWQVGDRLRLDLSQLDATSLGGLFQGLDGGGPSSLGPLNVADCLPAGAAITDVLSIRHDDGNSGVAIDQTTQSDGIFGLGTTCIDIILAANALQADVGGLGVAADLVGTGGTGSERRIFVEFELTYPIGQGTTDTVYEQLTPDPALYGATPTIGPGPVIAKLTNQNPADMETLLAPRFRQGYREIQLEYVADDTTSHGAPNPGVPVTETLVSQDANTLFCPRRLFDSRDTQVTDLLTTFVRSIDPSATEWGSSSRKIVTTDAMSGSGQVACRVVYYPQDPIPNYGNNGYQLSIYFRTHAPQTAGVSELPPGTQAGGVCPATLRVEPLLMSPDVWTNQIGSGSQDRGFPYAAPMDQIPVNTGDPGGSNVPEWYFCATADISVNDFNANTGMIALRPFVQADGQNVLTFGDAADVNKVPRKDQDLRAFYPFADDTVYRPTVLSQPLTGAVRHKVVYPFLARAIEEVRGGDGGLLYRKNELLLIVLTRVAQLDADNTVRFTDPGSDNRTCAALYRTRNLLLLVGDRAVSPGTLPM